MSYTPRSPLLPREDTRDSALFFVVSALCFLCALASLATWSAYGAAESWAGRVQGEASVRLTNASVADADRLAEAYRTQPGILSATSLSRDDMSDLLAPWLGNNMPADLPLPVRIRVELDGAADTETLSQLEEIAERAGLSVTIDSHDDWASDLNRSLAVLRNFGLAIVGILVTIVICVIAFATHAALLARRDVVHVLHTCGSSDRFISRLFEQRFFGLGLKGGITGSVLAFGAATVVYILAQHAGERNWLLPELQPDLGTGGILVLTPLLAAIVSMVAARITVGRALAELI